MLSPAYREIKRLRSTSSGAAAMSLLQAHMPTNEEDAFEAVVCLFVCGEIDNCLQVCRTYGWKSRWASGMTRALVAMLERGDAAQALDHARTAISDTGAGADASALFLFVLQANGLLDEADAYINRHFRSPPAGETLLLTLMAEVAAAVKDWKQAYQLASAVVSADPDDFRALMTLSIANLEAGNVHEALGNALRARLVRPDAQSAILQIMRCRNGLGDYYAAIGTHAALEGQAAIAPDIQVELGIAYAGLERTERAMAAFRAALASNPPPVKALRELLKLHAQERNAAEVQALAARYRPQIDNDLESLHTLGLECLDRRDLAAATSVFDQSFALARVQNMARDMLPWPVPEPRVRHDYEQLQLLDRRGRLDAAGRNALAILKRYCDQTKDLNARFAPPGAEAETLQQALTRHWYRPDQPFTGNALGENDYAAIEQQYFDNRPAVVVIDNFLSAEALAALRRHCEEATVWKLNNARGYTGALLAQGFSSPVLLAITDQLRAAMPRVIGDYPLLQAWGFKYDQRMQGINMHADFAKVNVNFWITPDEACQDKSTGGMVVYDVPAPASWTFADYNTDQSKMQAYLKVNGAKPMRVPFRENRCVLFDSSLIHITDELHFKPGYENRRVNVTLLYGRARSYG